MKSENAISMRVVKFLAVVSYAVCCGCDVDIPSLRKATEQVAKYTNEQTPKDLVEPAAAQIANARASLEHFAASSLKMIDASMQQTERGLVDVKSDRVSMSKRVTEISSKVYADKRAGAGDVLTELLKDSVLNSLAFKYLGGDFSLLFTEFIAKLRISEDMEKEKRQALLDNRQMYLEAIGAADGKDTANEKRIANEIAVSEKKIVEMEKRLRMLRSSMGGSRDAKLRREREIRNLENEIYRTRNRVDSIRRSASFNHTSRLSRSQAQMRFDNVNKDIERRYKNIMTVQQVADEYEQNTVKKLDAAMRSKEEGLEAKMATLDSQKVFISSVSTGIDKLGMADLKAIRDEIEKNLAHKPEAAAKRK